MDFYFPRSQIFLTAIPKTGCTSAMHFFTGLENSLEKINLNLTDSNFEEKIEIEYVESVMSIHELGDDSQRYLVLSDFSLLGQTSVAAFRNPFVRFASFWFDKVIQLRDRHYFNFGLTNYPSFEKLKIEDIRDSAKSFLSQDSQDQKNLDIHFRPQYYFYKEDLNYDVLIETEKLSDLPRILASKENRYRLISELEFPKFNTSLSSYPSEFYDDELSLLLRKSLNKKLF